jgi:hypothetical protein
LAQQTSSRMMTPYAYIDLDDTLTGYLVDGQVVPTHVVYDIAIERMVMLCDESGIRASPEALRAYQQAYDIELCKVYGFGSSTRFATSLVETYRHFATQEWEHDYVYEAAIYNAGMRIWKYEPAALPGALANLSWLTENYAVRIVTKGPLLQQLAKVEKALGKQYVANTVVRDHKNAQDWRLILSSARSLADSIAVGNSLVADVLIPMSLGVQNGYYLTDTGNCWAYESELATGPYSALVDRVVQVPSIADVPDALPLTI